MSPTARLCVVADLDGAARAVALTIGVRVSRRELALSVVLMALTGAAFGLAAGKLPPAQ